MAALSISARPLICSVPLSDAIAAASSGVSNWMKPNPLLRPVARSRTMRTSTGRGSGSAARRSSSVVSSGKLPKNKVQASRLALIAGEEGWGGDRRVRTKDRRVDQDMGPALRVERLADLFARAHDNL